MRGAARGGFQRIVDFLAPFFQILKFDLTAKFEFLTI